MHSESSYFIWVRTQTSGPVSEKSIRNYVNQKTKFVFLYILIYTSALTDLRRVWPYLEPWPEIESLEVLCEKLICYDLKNGEFSCFTKLWISDRFKNWKKKFVFIFLLNYFCDKLIYFQNCPVWEWMATKTWLNLQFLQKCDSMYSTLQKCDCINSSLQICDSIYSTLKKCDCIYSPLEICDFIYSTLKKWDLIRGSH